MVKTQPSIVAFISAFGALPAKLFQQPDLVFQTTFLLSSIVLVLVVGGLMLATGRTKESLSPLEWRLANGTVSHGL